MKTSTGWRSLIGAEWQDIRRRPHDPPDEPDGLCMYAGCPRTGTAVTGDLVACGYHRGADTVRARHKTPGPRSEQ